MHEVIALDDQIWRDAYLIGGETRVTEVAVACLLSAKRIYETEGNFSIRKGDHLAPEETIQRVVLNVVSLEPEATLERVAKRMRKTAPVVAIEVALVEAGLMKRMLGRLKPTAAGRAEAAAVRQANAGAAGPRGIAYAGS